MADIRECMDRLGYRFSDESLLLRALTHSSYAVEQHRMGADNERLEYLGDAAFWQYRSQNKPLLRHLPGGHSCGL